MESQEKVVQQEVLQGECQTSIRICTQVEGEAEVKVFDFSGQGVIGVMVNQEGLTTEGQGFLVGVDIPTILRGIEILLNMVDRQLKQESSLQFELARMALATLLIAKADKVVGDVTD